MAITDLAIETVEHIVADLDSPTDLQNFAAVYPHLRPIVESYAQFRVISTTLPSPLWKKLAENRLLAQKVRIVEIQGDYGCDFKCDHLVQVIPTMFSDLEIPPLPALDSFEDARAVRKYFAAKNTTDLDAERILVSALKGMSGLTSFRWERTPPLINHHREDDIWITLANHCPSLNVVDVLDREKPYEPLLDELDDPAYQRPSYNPNLYLFKDLRSFSLSTSAFGVGNFFLRPDVYLERCAKMLVERCPNLEVLELFYDLDKNPDTDFVFVSPFLSGPPWNSLRDLSLFYFEFISTELSSLLASHPTIENLTLMCCEINEPLVLPPHTLPRLKQLATDGKSRVVVDSILDSTIAIPRPLEHMTARGRLLNDVFLDRLEQCGSGPNLDSLVLRDDDGCSDLGHLMTRLSGIAPNLESLEINSDHLIDIDPTFYPVFGQFPYLRALKGMMQFISPSCEPASENTERIRALATLCPNLRYIGAYQIDPVYLNLTVIIERNGSHGTWSLHRTCIVRKFDYVHTRWGARGQGSFEL